MNEVRTVPIIFGDFKQEYEGLKGVACVICNDKLRYEGTIVSDQINVGDKYRVNIEIGPELIRGDANIFRGCEFRATNIDIMTDQASGRSKIVLVEFERVTSKNADKFEGINI